MADDFGSYLKHQRELRGISLDEIASITKIHIRYLKALENNTFDDLPGEVFIKGFIRSYGRAIGANLQELISAYDETVGRERLENREKVEKESNNETQKQVFLVNAIVGGFLGLFILFAIWYLLQNPPKEETAVKPGSTLSSNETPPAPSEKVPDSKTISAVEKGESRVEGEIESASPVKTDSTKVENGEGPPDKEKKTEVGSDTNSESETTGPETTSSSSQKPVAEKENGAIIENQKAQQVQEDSAKSTTSEEAEAKLTMVIKVSENAWFNLAVDNADKRDFILPAGEEKEFKAKEQLVVTIGNRRGTKLVLNGKELALPSTPDNVVRNFKVNSKLIE